MRGKILRDTNAGPGLLSAGGTQYQFTLEGGWASEVPPAVGMVIEADIVDGQVRRVTAVPEAQLAREQAEAALAAARQKGGQLASAAVARFGPRTLIAAGVLVLGWFFLSSVSVRTPLGGLNFTFWQLLKVLNGGGLAEMMQRMGGSGGSAGLYGLLAVAAVAGPFLPFFWKDRRAHLGSLAPLAMILLVVAVAGYNISQAFSVANEGIGALGNNAEMRQAAQQMADQAAAEMRKAISLGLGAYLATAAGLYFAVIGGKKYLAAGA